MLHELKSFNNHVSTAVVISTDISSKHEQALVNATLVSQQGELCTMCLCPPRLQQNQLIPDLDD